MMATDHLSGAIGRKRQSEISPTAFRIAAGIVGLVVMGLLIVQGALSNAATLSALAATTTLALILLIVLGASAPVMTSGRRTVLHTLVPLTGGIVVIAVLVGRGYFLGEMGWWLPAAVVSAVPIVVIATLPVVRRS